MYFCSVDKYVNNIYVWICLSMYEYYGNGAMSPMRGVGPVAVSLSLGVLST